MPELPEVETVRRDLARLIIKESFVSLNSSVPKVVFPSIAAFDQVKGLKVEDLQRRGKFLQIILEQDWVITLHLRMTGQLLALKKPIDLDVVPPTLKKHLPFERSRLDFSQHIIVFADIRKFGRIWLCKRDQVAEATGICRLGAEPFDPQLNFGRFQAIMARKNSGAIKKHLLDQALIAGIGNIFADEICFAAGIRPTKDISKLKKSELKNLFEQIKIILRQGIDNRGTTISDFVDLHGQSGNNQNLLKVYGRKGKKCLNCASDLQKTKVAGRTTIYCPRCQK
jgi:formamidopyrimidine-DNA glycosylase